MPTDTPALNCSHDLHSGTAEPSSPSQPVTGVPEDWYRALSDLLTQFEQRGYLNDPEHPDFLAAQNARSLLAAAAQPPTAVVPRIEFTLHEATRLVGFFGGHDTRVTVELHPDRIDDDRMHFAGLYAYCTEYPEEGADYLGPVEVQDEDHAAAHPAPEAPEGEAVHIRRHILAMLLDAGTRGVLMAGEVFCEPGPDTVPLYTRTAAAETRRDCSLRMAAKEGGQDVGAGSHGIPDEPAPEAGDVEAKPGTYWREPGTGRLWSEVDLRFDGANTLGWERVDIPEHRVASSPRDGELTDDECEAIYRAVAMANLTRDVKSPDRKRAIVRNAIDAARDTVKGGG